MKGACSPIPRSRRLTLKTLSIVWLGGFLGGVASGAAGFAYGVVATAIWLHAISPLHATILVVSGGLIIQSSLVFKMRRALDWPRLAPFLIAGLIGVPIGVALVVKTDQARSGFGLPCSWWSTASMRSSRRGCRTSQAAAKPRTLESDFFGGLMGGLAGLSGLAPAIWTQLRGWPKTWRAASISRSF